MADVEGRWTLPGNLPRCTTWVSIDDGGRLVVEWYDRSETAESFLGGEVAYILRVELADLARVRALLESDAGAARAGEAFQWGPALAARFATYFDVKSWLEANAVPFTVRVDDWA